MVTMREVLGLLMLVQLMGGALNPLDPLPFPPSAARFLSALSSVPSNTTTTMTSKDIRDILALQPNALAGPSHPAPKKQKQERPAGISRELQALIGDSAPSLAQVRAELGIGEDGIGRYKERKEGRKKVNWWVVAISGRRPRRSRMERLKESPPPKQDLEILQTRSSPWFAPTLPLDQVYRRCPRQ